MASELVRSLVEAGVHFGHRVSRWNPKMQRYIFDKRNSIHIIDIRETVRGLLRARKLVAGIVAQGYDVLLVGTKRQARETIDKQARRIGMPFVTERWLGGTLTNFRTIRSRLERLEELEKLEQTGTMGDYSKKMKSMLQRELRKIRRNLDGIRTMTNLPGALVIVDVKREYIAVREARKLGIPTICLVDTDSDPDVADVVIPGNDDAMRAIDIIIAQISEAIEEGMRGRAAAPPPAAAGETPPVGQRRSRRMTTTAAATLTESPPPMTESPAAEPMAWAGASPVAGTVGPS